MPVTRSLTTTQMDTPLTLKHFLKAIGSLAELQAPDAPGLPQDTFTTETAIFPQQSTISINISQGLNTFTVTEVIYFSSDEDELKDKGKKCDPNPQESPLEHTPDSDKEDEAYCSFLEQQRRIPISTEASTSSHAPDTHVELHLKVHRDFRSICDFYKQDQQELHQQQTIMFDILS